MSSARVVFNPATVTSDISQLQAAIYGSSELVALNEKIKSIEGGVRNAISGDGKTIAIIKEGNSQIDNINNVVEIRSEDSSKDTTIDLADLPVENATLLGSDVREIYFDDAGNTLVIGDSTGELTDETSGKTYSAGRVIVYNFDSLQKKWVNTLNYIGTNENVSSDSFLSVGWSVSISGDGKTVVAFSVDKTEPYPGIDQNDLRIWKNINNEWVLQVVEQPNNGLVGFAGCVAIDKQGENIVLFNRATRVMYIFAPQNNVWKVKYSESFSNLFPDDNPGGLLGRVPPTIITMEDHYRISTGTAAGHIYVFQLSKSAISGPVMAFTKFPTQGYVQQMSGNSERIVVGEGDYDNSRGSVKVYNLTYDNDYKKRDGPETGKPTILANLIYRVDGEISSRFGYHLSVNAGYWVSIDNDGKRMVTNALDTNLSDVQQVYLVDEPKLDNVYKTLLQSTQLNEDLITQNIADIKKIDSDIYGELSEEQSILNEKIKNVMDSSGTNWRNFISGDGKTVVISNENFQRPIVRIISVDNKKDKLLNLTETQVTDQFNFYDLRAISLSNDGNVIVFPNSFNFGEAQVWEFKDNVWNKTYTILPQEEYPDSGLAYDCQVSSNGKVIILYAMNMSGYGDGYKLNFNPLRVIEKNNDEQWQEVTIPKISIESYAGTAAIDATGEHIIAFARSWYEEGMPSPYGNPEMVMLKRTQQGWEIAFKHEQTALFPAEQEIVENNFTDRQNSKINRLGRIKSSIVTKDDHFIISAGEAYSQSENNNPNFYSHGLAVVMKIKKENLSKPVNEIITTYEKIPLFGMFISRLNGDATKLLLGALTHDNYRGVTLVYDLEYPEVSGPLTGNKELIVSRLIYRIEGEYNGGFDETDQSEGFGSRISTSHVGYDAGITADGNTLLIGYSSKPGTINYLHNINKPVLKEFYNNTIKNATFMQNNIYDLWNKTFQNKDSLASEVSELNVVNTGKNLEKMIGFYKNDPNQPSISIEPSVITGIFSNATLTTGTLDNSFSQVLLLPNPQSFNVIGDNYIEIARVYDTPQYINPITLIGKHTMQVSKYYFNDSFTRMTVHIEYFGVDPAYEESTYPGITQQLQSVGYLITPPYPPSGSTPLPIEYSLKVRPLYRIKMDDSEVPDAMKVYQP